MSSSKETNLSQTLVNNLEDPNLLVSLPPQARVLYKEAIRESSNNLAPTFSNTIDTESNRTLNTVPENLIGPTNPLDIVAGNLTTNDLKTNITNVIKDPLTSSLSASLTTNVFNNFLNKLPPGLKSTLNLNIVKDSLSSKSLTALNKGIDLNVGLFSTDALSGKIPVVPIVPDISSFFERGGAGGLEQVNQQFDSALSSEAVTEAQKFNVNSTENQEKLITQTTGFIDPTATLPTKEYAGRTDTNKLAQGEVNGTIVQKKEKDRLTGIQLPNAKSWEQPNIPFKGEYPYNKVIQTEGGHVIEIDDTPGVERIHVYHKSGTFFEIDVNGSVVRRTKGSSYEIIDKNGYISVSGDANLSVKGSIKIFVGGNADIEVEGDTNINCFNDITMQAAGRVDISATEEINLHSANVRIEADNTLDLKGDVKSFLSSANIYFKANSTIFSEVGENYNVLAGQSIFQQSTEKFNIKSGENFNVQSGEQINLKSTGDANIDADKIYWNSDKAGDAEEATESIFANSANIGLLGGRRDIVLTTIGDPVSPNYLDKLGYGAEDAEFESEADAQAKILKQSGIASKQKLEETPIPIETETPTSQVSRIIIPDQSIITKTSLPDNFQLSKHFTLGQLSSRAVVSNYPVQAQLGLSYGQLVYNLSGIALNVLEPLLALYPDMFVTSAFRTAKSSSTTSDHPRGKAVDIQFKKATKADYYEIAKKLATNLNYDKLLLEYKTYGTGLPWIHISFDIEKPRKIVLTYLNDKKYGDGLTNLA